MRKWAELAKKPIVLGEVESVYILHKSVDTKFICRKKANSLPVDKVNNSQYKPASQLNHLDIPQTI